MKKLLLLASSLLLVVLIGCRKGINDTANCTWFPIQNQSAVNYQATLFQANNQIPTPYNLSAPVTNKKTLTIDGYQFTLSDCDKGQITLSYGANINNMLAIDKNAADGTVLSSNSAGKFQVISFLTGGRAYGYFPTGSSGASIQLYYTDNKGISKMSIVTATTQTTYIMQ